MSDKNPFPGENNTGHIWDDNIRELDNPPPIGGCWRFWASIAWVVIYAVLYPMFPGISGNTKGIMGWSQIKEYNEGLNEVMSARADYEARIKDKSAAQILADPDLKGYTLAAARCCLAITVLHVMALKGRVSQASQYWSMMTGCLAAVLKL